jgi:hypothetical protein
MKTLQKNDKWLRFSGKVGAGRVATGAVDYDLEERSLI